MTDHEVIDNTGAGSFALARSNECMNNGTIINVTNSSTVPTPARGVIGPATAR